MNKHILVSLITAASIFSMNNTFASDGTVNFTGEILDQACEVDLSSQNQTVNLGKVFKSAFAGVGDTAAATSFQINLINCPTTVAGAAVKFDATAYPGDDSVINLTQEASVATGVGIQLTDNEDVVVPLFTDSKSYPLIEGSNTLEFRARYIAQNTIITAGPANATSTFTLIYN